MSKLTEEQQAAIGTLCLPMTNDIEVNCEFRAGIYCYKRPSEPCPVNPVNKVNDVAAQKHYTELEIQPIVIMLKDLPPAQFEGFLRCNVLKYALRTDGKNGLEDIQKCKQYATWWEEFRRTGTITVSNRADTLGAAREWHHYYSDSGSDDVADARSIVNMLEQLFPELRREGVER